MSRFTSRQHFAQLGHSKKTSCLSGFFDFATLDDHPPKQLVVFSASL